MKKIFFFNSQSNLIFFYNNKQKSEKGKTQVSLIIKLINYCKEKCWGQPSKLPYILENMRGIVQKLLEILEIKKMFATICDFIYFRSWKSVP